MDSETGPALIAEFKAMPQIRFSGIDKIPEYRHPLGDEELDHYVGDFELPGETGDRLSADVWSYSDYILIKIYGDTDFTYYYDKELKCITHSYEHDNIYLSDCLSVVAEHGDRILGGSKK